MSYIQFLIQVTAIIDVIKQCDKIDLAISGHLQEKWPQLDSNEDNVQFMVLHGPPLPPMGLHFSV